MYVHRINVYLEHARDNFILIFSTSNVLFAKKRKNLRTFE